MIYGTTYPDCVWEEYEALAFPGLVDELRELILNEDLRLCQMEDVLAGVSAIGRGDYFAVEQVRAALSFENLDEYDRVQIVLDILEERLKTKR